MKTISENKYKLMEKLSTKNGIISALAIDQRGSLKKMLGQYNSDNIEEKIRDFKEHISKELTPYSSSILLDPEYGLPATKVKDEESGLLLAYEKTGYDASEPGRLPDLLEEWSVKRLKEEGADGIKFLLYYDVDEPASINHQKQVFVERIGSECVGEDIPFFLEILTYDSEIDDVKGKAYAKIKPRKVNEAMKEFSKPRYQADVLKVEVPVNMHYVEGYTTEESPVYSKEEAMNYFVEQSQSTDLPFIFLSAGVSAQLFQETLIFAKEAGSDFNGVLCGRATWKGSVDVYAEKGSVDTTDWLQTEGQQNIKDLNHVLSETAESWKNKLQTIESVTA